MYVVQYTAYTVHVHVILVCLGSSLISKQALNYTITVYPVSCWNTHTHTHTHTQTIQYLAALTKTALKFAKLVWHSSA